MFRMAAVGAPPMTSKSRVTQELQRHDPSGIERFGATWTSHKTQHHAHPEYQLTLSVKGTGRFTYLGGEAKIPAGCMAIFHPGEPHVIGNGERGTPWQFRVLHVPSRWIDSRGAFLLQPAPVLVDTALGDAFDAVWNAVDGSRAVIERALSRLADVLVARPGLEWTSRPRSALVRQALAYLAEVIDRPVGMAELALEVSASSAQIRRAVLAATGLPPLAWHLQRRIQESKHLLVRGDSVAETALAVGFADQAHFTRHFTRLVGVGPSRYAAGVRGRGAVD